MMHCRTISGGPRRRIRCRMVSTGSCCPTRVLRLQPGHRYCLLGQLSKEVGWNYAQTIRSVEAAAAVAAVAGGTRRSPHGCCTSEVASATPFFWYYEVLVGLRLDGHAAVLLCLIIPIRSLSTLSSSVYVQKI
ncbi:uncharacterized protein [Triticum aestivum]|uniref:uncharacterized protein isoform X2 n=1 Tax=Triticum aestivum TaxID=4565 RepID=UPI001D0199D7|nr:uncharacterized protein LOC123137258 isoform X2 [Triticum aestivum]